MNVERSTYIVDLYERTMAVYLPAAEVYHRCLQPPVRVVTSDRTWYNFRNGIRKTGARLEPAPGVSHRGVSSMTAYDSTTLARFWKKVDKSGDCWLWTASTTVGYGQFFPTHRPHKRMVYAHRLSYELVHGPIPPGLQICHTCDNRRCVNPAHMFLGTHKDNAEDRERKGRSPRGTARPNAKLDEAKVRAIRARVAVGEKQAALAREYGVAAGTIQRIIERRSWKFVA